jgi:hypothetical protein
VNVAVDPDANEAGLADILENPQMVAFAIHDQGGQNENAAVVGHFLHALDDLFGRLGHDGTTAFGAVRGSGSGKEEAQIVINFGYGADGGAGVVAHPFLVD